MTLTEAQRKKIEEEENYRTQIRGLNAHRINSSRTNKNRIIAALLAIFLGAFGVHKFYLGKVSWGITYLLLSWTAIPMIIGIFEGIFYLLMSDKSFELKYS